MTRFYYFSTSLKTQKMAGRWQVRDENAALSTLSVLGGSVETNKFIKDVTQFVEHTHTTAHCEWMHVTVRHVRCKHT